MKHLDSLSLLALSLLSGPAVADVLVLDASKDNTLYFTIDGALSNAKGQYFFSGRNGSGQIRRGLIAFDVASALPPGSTINSASLQLHMSKTVAGTQQVHLRRALANWGEANSMAFGEEGGGAAAMPGDATWLHTYTPGSFWATQGGDFSGTSSASTGVAGVGTYTWTGLASDVQDMLDTPGANFGWFVIGNEGASSTAKRFDTRENVNTSFRPALTVDYTPPAFFYPDSCSGDGGDQLGCTACPCTNEAPIGTVGGCLNSAGTSTRLIATGDASISLPSGATTDLRFAATGGPAAALCVLVSGDAVAPTNAANPCFGLDSGVNSVGFDGLRCAVSNTRRHGGRTTDASGSVGTTNSPWGGEGGPPAGIGAAASHAAGQTRYFQITHRDDPLAICATGLNTSQAVEVTFAP